MQVDEAHYEGSNLIANVTIWNTCDFGINNIQDMMVALYDANDDLITTGSFFFDAPYQDEYGIVESDDYTETTLVFGADSGSATRKNWPNSPQPSISAASYSSPGMLVW